MKSELVYWAPQNLNDLSLENHPFDLHISLFDHLHLKPYTASSSRLCEVVGGRNFSSCRDSTDTHGTMWIGAQVHAGYGA